MSSKVEILAKVQNNSQYLGSYVKELINSVHCEDSPNTPKHFKKSDVIKVNVQQDGTSKPRPSVVIKVTKEYLVSIPITTKEDGNALCSHSGSRFFKEGWFCNTYVITPIERASFIGIYENTKDLNNAIKELRIFINRNV